MTPEMPKDLPAGMTSFPPSDVRPADYPAELPFVPGVACIVGERTDPQGEPILLCTWMAADEDESALDGWRAQAHALGERAQGIPLVARFAGLTERFRGREPEAMKREAQQLVSETTTAGERDALTDFMRVQQEVMRGRPETEDAVERVARAATEASIADGWIVESEQTIPFPVQTRIVKMRRGDRSRAVSRMAAAFGGHVMLMETPVRDEDTAPPPSHVTG